MNKAMALDPVKYQELLARYPVVTKRSIIAGMTDEERSKAWEKVCEHVDKLPANYESQIEQRLKTNPTSVRVNNRSKVGTAWTYRFYVDYFECELEVKKFNSEKYEDTAYFYAYNPFDHAVHVRNLKEL